MRKSPVSGVPLMSPPVSTKSKVSPLATGPEWVMEVTALGLVRAATEELAVQPWLLTAKTRNEYSTLAERPEKVVEVPVPRDWIVAPLGSIEPSAAQVGTPPE